MWESVWIIFDLLDICWHGTHINIFPTCLSCPHSLSQTSRWNQCTRSWTGSYSTCRCSASWWMSRRTWQKTQYETPSKDVGPAVYSYFLAGWVSCFPVGGLEGARASLPRLTGDSDLLRARRASESEGRRLKWEASHFRRGLTHGDDTREIIRHQQVIYILWLTWL